MPLSFNKCFISVNLKTWSPEGTENPENPQNLHDGDRTRAEEGKHLQLGIGRRGEGRTFISNLILMQL